MRNCCRLSSVHLHQPPQTVRSLLTIPHFSLTPYHIFCSTSTSLSQQYCSEHARQDHPRLECRLLHPLRLLGGYSRFGIGEDNGENGENAEDPPDDPAAAAERTIRVTTASLGRFVGGALLIPKISSWMGSLLFRLSKYSFLLRYFLGIRPPRMGPPEVFGKWFDSQPWSRMTAARQLGVGMHMALSVMCGGTKTFAECDPVW